MPSDAPHERSHPPGDEEIATTFRRLRRDGHSRLEAVRTILDVLDVSLARAKRLLIDADTWAEAQTDSNTDSTPPGPDGPPPAPG